MRPRVPRKLRRLDRLSQPDSMPQGRVPVIRRAGLLLFGHAWELRSGGRGRFPDHVQGWKLPARRGRRNMHRRESWLLRAVFGSDFAKRMPTGNIPIDRGQDRLPPSGPRQLRFRDRRNRTDSLPIRDRAGTWRADRMHRRREAPVDDLTDVRSAHDRPRDHGHSLCRKQEEIHRWRPRQGVHVLRGHQEVAFHGRHTSYVKSPSRAVSYTHLTLPTKA